MALKKLGIKAGKKPERLKDIQIMQDKDKSITYYFQTQQLAFQTLWPNMTELEEDLVDLLCSNIRLYYPGVPAQGTTPENYYNTQEVTASMFNSYGNLLLRSKIFDFIDKWDGTLEDVSSIYHVIENLKNDVIIKNRKRWTDLFNSTIQEFNPLYNVDAYEETTRTLEQDGTFSNQKTGTETSKKTGTETDTKSGTETSARTGTEQTVTDEETADRKTGTETIARTGAEQITYDTEEKTDYDGSEATTHQKAETTTESVTTTESNTFFDTKKTQDVGAANDNVDTLEYSNDRADTLSKTGTETTTFNNRQDQTTFNTTDTITHDNEVTTTHNTQDQLTHNTTDTLTHNTTDQLTHNTTDLESRDLLDTEHILHRRYGNIGITMSTQLLESFRNFVNYRIIDVVAADIAEALTQGVY